MYVMLDLHYANRTENSSEKLESNTICDETAWLESRQIYAPLEGNECTIRV